MRTVRCATLAQIAGARVGRAAPREVEELADDLGHARRLLDDDARAVDAPRRRLASPAAIILARAGDHVERRAELVRDARGELADGRQPIGVAELLDGSQLGRALCARGRSRASTSRSHIAFISRASSASSSRRRDRRQAPRQIAGADAARLLDEEPNRLADEVHAERERDARCR